MTDFVFKPKGKSSKGWNAGLARWGWGEKPIFQHRSYVEFYLTTSYSLERENLYEYVIWDEGTCVGSIIAVVEMDQHVGQCLSVRWALTRKTGALLDGYRKLYKLAKKLNIGWVCYTKEIAPMTYTMRYKKVK